MLANHLETPQARESLLIADVKMLPAASEFHGHGFSVVIEHTGAWWRCRVTAGIESIAAYYRPDGDRYIVTDLGEGVRARALRTGEVGGPMHSDSPCQIAEAASCMPRGIGNRTWVDGALYVEGIEAKDLPDAICRVMLASLRVAGVNP